VRIFSGLIATEGQQRYRRIALKAGGISRNGPLPADSDVATPWKLDESLHVLYLETVEGRPHSVLLNFTAHPVVAMTLPQVSADYPGAATALVEKAFPGAICLFTNGCAGNINPIQVATNFTDVETIGHRLGQSALECVGRLKSAPALTDTRLAVLSEDCTL